jgi:hypothetical protein
MDDSVGVHTNCKAGFIIIVRRIISDVPALNLKCDYSSLESEGAVRLSFDWRSTMTIIMSEEEVIDNGVTASVCLLPLSCLSIGSRHLRCPSMIQKSCRVRSLAAS